MKTTCVLILEHKKTYLLQLRDNKKNIPECNKWGLFGGQKEKNENKLNCIKREILEELNYRISNPLFIGKVKHKEYLINIFFKKTKKKLFIINEGSGYGLYSKLEIIGDNCKLPSSKKKYLLGKSTMKVFKYFLNKA